MPPDSPEFFIDRCLGSQVIPKALADLGLVVHVHDDHFAQDCKDEEWPAEVGRRGWVVLSKDGRIERRYLELEALKAAKVAAFILISAGLDGPMMAEVVKRALPRMQKLLASHTGPFLGRIYKDGKINVLLGERRGGVKRDR